MHILVFITCSELARYHGNAEVARILFRVGAGIAVHDKNLLHQVRVDGPNANYAAMLLEQLGGPQGELKAALQYLSQSMRIKEPEIKDLFLDIASEELNHMEMVAATVNKKCS